MQLNHKNPAFKWEPGPLAEGCIAFVANDGTPFLVPRETLRVEMAKASLNGEKLPTFKAFFGWLYTLDIARPRK